MKKIVITGASGFVGKALTKRLLDTGNEVVGMGTSPVHPFDGQMDGFTWVPSDTTIPGNWQEYITRADIVINLAGRNIFKYWTKKYKQAIYDSRIKTTKNIVSALTGKGKQTLLNASAVGIYGDCQDAVLTEGRPAGSGFLADVCIDWEKQAQLADEKGVRVAVLRFGVVLGAGGALEKMLLPFKMGAGGPLGSGQHWFPWIHIDDLMNALIFIVEHPEMSGAYNFTGPEPVRQKTFARTLGKCLNRPSFVPAPAAVIRVVMGELGASLLQSQKAVPDRLEKAGFQFRFVDVKAALTDLLKK